MIEDSSLRSIISKIPLVSPDRGYWFVRTYGGQYFDDFYKSNFIAIGYDRIESEEIQKAPVNELDQRIAAIGKKIQKEYRDEQRSVYIASQLYKFAHEIKRGDVVLSPSRSSSSIAFGVVSSSEMFTQSIKSDDPHVCPFRKRKKVKWFAHVRRDGLDPNLYKLMYSQHIVTDGSQYGEYIDRIANSIFIKDELAHIVLDVQTTNKIKATHLFEMGSGLLLLFKEFCEEQKLPYNSDDVDVRLNLRSPGIIELTGVAAAIIILGIILVGLAGGDADFKIGGQDVKFKTPGILASLSDFLDRKLRRKALVKLMAELEMKNPEELVKIIGKIEKE